MIVQRSLLSVFQSLLSWMRVPPGGALVAVGFLNVPVFPRGRSVPSAAFTRWQNDRTLRLIEVDGHCAAVLALVPPNPTFLDETLRGFVLHLSAHFQGFCRDLYTECSQIWIAAIPAGFQATAQAQFCAHLALEKGNPNHDIIKRDFNRFGFLLNLQAANPAAGLQQVTDLGHLNAW